MESFDTKDCEVMESFDRKFEKFPSKDSEFEEPTSEISESFDRKIEEFRSKDSDLDVPPNKLSESFDRMFGSSESKDSGDNVPVDGVLESFDRKFESFESKDSNNTRRVTRKDSKLDGRSRLRSVKQIEAYKRNFHKGDSIELRLRELDTRMRHLQSLVLGVLRGR
jgi:hypothetical protein